MSWLYNRRFKIGAGLAVTAFIVANVVSYLEASRRAAELAALEASHSRLPAQIFVWGWPFPWVDWVAAVNVAVLLLGALFFGLLFRWIAGIIK